jgi:hypothetical protein
MRIHHLNCVSTCPLGGAPVEIICGHDPYEFERIARKPAAERRSVRQEMAWRKRWQA